MTKPTLADGMAARAQAQARTVKVAAQAASGKMGRERTVGLTLRLDAERWRKLRLLAIERETKLQTLMLEGVDWVLQQGKK